MEAKIKHFIHKTWLYLVRFRDVRVAGQAIFVVIVLLISWSGVKAIQTNYGLQKQVASINQQDSIQQLQNNNLSLQNKYYNSNQYLELSARQNLGLAAPGEKEVLVPASVALTYTVNLPVANQQMTASSEQPHTQHNFEAWVNFFLHRQR